MQNLEQNSQIL